MRREDSAGGGWAGVGCHPTPEECVAEFAQLTADAFRRGHNGDRDVRIVDICAGDGRLGHAVARLLEQHGVRTTVTFVEVDGRKARHICGDNVVHANAFEWQPRSKFDLVIANPPYVSLNVKDADALGLAWDALRQSGRNLYRLAIQKGLDICEDGGLVSMLAPFGWLKSDTSGQFRRSIAAKCSRIEVWAHKSRRMFPNVNQDTAIQLFFAGASASTTPLCARFAFLGDSTSEAIVLERPHGAISLQPRWEIGVGPVVWNRERKRLRGRRVSGSVPLIYGANIGHDGTLNFDVAKVGGRQHLTEPKSGELLRGPAIVLRRTLRGRPGAWFVDAAYVASGSRCAVENHSIYIRGMGKATAGQVHALMPILTAALKRAVETSGSPNITVAEVIAVIEGGGGRRALLQQRQRVARARRQLTGAKHYPSGM